MSQTQQKDGTVKISSQIAVYKTHKALLEFNDRLHIASVNQYANIHGSGKDENGSGIYSRIGIVAQDYSKGTGNDLVRCTCNIEPENIAYLYLQLCSGVRVFGFRQEKIFGQLKEQPERGIVTKLTISRKPTNEQGEARNYPWFVEVQNGNAVKAQSKTGGYYIKPNTYVMTGKVQISLNDQDMFALLHRVNRYLQIWENVHGESLLKLRAKSLAAAQ